MTSTRTWRGLTLGGFTSPYRIEKETGLDDLDVRSGSRNLPRSDGAAPGPHYAEPREVVVDLFWGAATAAAAEALTETLRAVTGPSETTLYDYGIIRADGTAWFLRARIRRRRLPRDVLTETVGHVAGSLVLEAPDPRIYSVENPGVLVAEYSTTGAGWNLAAAELPLNAASSAPAFGVAENEGTANAYPVISFHYPDGETGDADGFTITNLTTGQTLEVVTTITAGQTLIVDMDALVRASGALVVHIANSSRYGSWTPPRDPFALVPGINLLRFDLDGDAPIVARVYWRHTDL